MSKKSIFLGCFFIIIAISILTNALGITMHFPIFKALICAFLLVIAIDGLAKKRPFELLVPIAIIVSIILSILDIETKIAGFPLIAAAVLVSIGINIILKGNNRVVFVEEDYESDPEDVQAENEEAPEGEERVYSKKITPVKKYTEENKKISFDTVFSSARRNINAVFETAEINTIFGDSGIYFNDAIPFDGTATIDANAIFGSLKIYVPADWQLNVKTESVAGSVKVHGEQAYSEYTAEVTLKGAAVFGSIDIYYV